MVDEPEAGSEKNGAEKAEGGYAAWPFVALGRLVRRLFLLADKHNGGITALATIAIMALTGFYVSYSKNSG